MVLEGVVTTTITVDGHIIIVTSIRFIIFIDKNSIHVLSENILPAVNDQNRHSVGKG